MADNASGNQAPDSLRDDVRTALRGAAQALTVVLVRDAREVRGATVSSFMPVTLDPPHLAVAIGRQRWLHESLLEADVFTVCILAEGQEDVADRFANRSRRDRGVHAVRFASTPAGAPTLPDCLASFECIDPVAHGVGDHSLVVGQVRAAWHDSDALPLLWREGSFAYVAPPER